MKIPLVTWTLLALLFALIAKAGQLDTLLSDNNIPMEPVRKIKEVLQKVHHTTVNAVIKDYATNYIQHEELHGKSNPAVEAELLKQAFRVRADAVWLTKFGQKLANSIGERLDAIANDGSMPNLKNRFISNPGDRAMLWQYYEDLSSKDQEIFEQQNQLLQLVLELLPVYPNSDVVEAGMLQTLATKFANEYHTMVSGSASTSS